MNTKIYKWFILGMVLLFAPDLVHAKNEEPLKVYDLEIDVNNQTSSLGIKIELDLKEFKVNRNSEIIFTPVLMADNGKDSLVFDPITICGRTRWYFYQREGLLDQGDAGIYRAGTQGKINITRQVAFEDWMGHSTLEMKQVKASCCGNPQLIPGDTPNGNVLLAAINTQKKELDYEYVFSPPMEDKPVTKSIKGSAFVTFVVNRTELNPDYMRNPQEIQKILNSINIVKADSDAIITEVHIRGYASPEGPYENNVRLAKGRTETLSKYVGNLYNFKPGIMTTSYDPEDWGGLRAYVKDSLDFKLKNRAALLAVIDGPLGFDVKDASLKNQFPDDYAIILKEIYPWLRRSDYTVNYSIKVYTDMENIMRLYNQDPTKLRPVDFYIIAQQYPTGSKAYLDVMKRAVEVYPDEPMINLNMANLYLMEGDFEAAQSCLLKTGVNPSSNFARGVLAAKRGDFNEAEKYFKVAQEAGIEQAGLYLKQISERKTTNPVTIFIPTTKR